MEGRVKEFQAVRRGMGAAAAVSKGKGAVTFDFMICYSKKCHRPRQEKGYDKKDCRMQDDAGCRTGRGGTSGKTVVFTTMEGGSVWYTGEQAAKRCFLPPNLIQ